MNDDVIATSGSLAISRETLRAFAIGQLDEATEQQVLVLLDTRPDLAAQVAAISSDSMLEKMKSHGQPAAPISLSSQLTPANQEHEDAGSAKHPLKTPPELAELTDFKILKEIGRGGMGVVYLAEHLLTGRKEVLKVLNERLMTNPEARKRFDQEIKCIAAMNHETIVRCYTVQQLPSAIVLCMEYVPGTNLHQFIHTNGPLPIHIACGIATEVCRGLQHAMENGLVHRDIKPSNIMLYKSEGKIKAKILDFGLARLNTHENTKGLTDDGTLLGTLEYIAPEQCLNAAAADIRSDIYSLGCTLYHMLVGHPPFTGSSGELVLAHSTKVPPAVNLIQQHVPLELANIVAKMLAKNPAKRYPTPLTVAKELQAFSKKPPKTNNRESHAKDLPAESVNRTATPQAEIDTSVATNTVTSLPKSAIYPSANPEQQSTKAIGTAIVVSEDFVANNSDSHEECEQDRNRQRLQARKKLFALIGITIPLVGVFVIVVVMLTNINLTSDKSIDSQTADNTAVAAIAEADVPKESELETTLPSSPHEDILGTWYLEFVPGPVTMVATIRSDGTGSLVFEGEETDGHMWGQISPGKYFFDNPNGSRHTFQFSGGKLIGRHANGAPFTGIRIAD